MTEEYPVNLRVDLTPDNSSLLLSGSITITRTTISVFKLCEMNDEEPLFIGVCSVPLLKFARRPSKVYPSCDALVLMSISDHLFINASLSAGIVPAKDGSVVSSRTASTGLVVRTPRDDAQSDWMQRLDNPAQWRKLRLEFPTADDCDRCVEALLARNAEDATVEYASTSRRTGDGAAYPDEVSPRTRSVRASESGTSLRSYNNNRAEAEDSAMRDCSELMQSCRSPSQMNDNSRLSSTLQQQRRELNLSGDNRLELDSPSGRNTPRSSHHSRGLPARSHPTNSRREWETPHESAHDMPLDRPRTSQREVLTPHESRDSRNTPRSSHHSRGLPARSNPTNSRRELETPSDVRTPRDSAREGSRREHDAAIGSHTPRSVRKSQSIPAGSQPAASQREALTPRSSHHSRGLPARSNPTDSRRELETPSDVRTPRDSAREGSRREHDAPQMSMNQTSAREGPPASSSSTRNGHSHTSPRETNSAVQPPPPPSSSSLLHASPNAARMVEATQPTHATSHPYGSITPLPYSPHSQAATTVRSSRNRTEYQYFMRNVMKLMHHRLHSMQYLHKELVHQAYLAEEARLLGGRGRSRASRSASVNHSVSRPTSVSPRSPRRTAHSSVAEESSRLREIEERLREVETLQREAEQDRREAALLRREAEVKLESISRESGVVPRRLSPSHDVSDVNECNASVHSLNVRSSANDNNRQQRHQATNTTTPNNVSNGNVESKLPSFRQNHSGNEPSSSHSRPRDTETSHGSRHSTLLAGSGQVAIMGQQLQLQLLQADTPSEEDNTVSIVDRYIYGDEWNLLYPSRESDVRFNALIDVCLMLKLPRRFVTITSVSVDQPGLRLTVEIHHNRQVLPREVLERRFSSQPFCFLQRLYELRHIISGTSNDTAISQMSRNGWRMSRGGSRVTSPQAGNRASAMYPPSADDDTVVMGSDGDAAGDSLTDMENRMREMQRRTEERARQREREVRKDREQKQLALMRERLHQQADQLDQEESLRRSRIVLTEAQERQSAAFDKELSHRHTFAMTRRALEEKEQVERAMVEVGYARQAQALAQAQRRNMAFARLAAQERERRIRLAEQETEDRGALDLILNPNRDRAVASQTEVNERVRRQRLIEAEAKQRAHICANIRSFLFDALQDELEALFGDEKTARMVLTADEMKERIDIVYNGQAPRSGATSPGATCVTPQAWQALLAEESAERVHLANDEVRRRHLFQREYIVTTEDVTRNEIELKELDEHIVMLDDIVQCNRAMLERRRQERQNLVKLVNEEQYYRKGVLGDEQDAWEVLMELFDSELNDVLLAEAARLAAASDLESPQRRRRATGTPRQTKPFHYMTFVPEDMDHLPSANLAIEGILGCSINKNLEVTSIARPLPKVEEEELQFQAGDMILDVAGYSLHSLSHLREVLSNRSMQIQHEAREEFPDVPEEELTVNPALQKYVEVLCEHHNFLVQVLRGCDIFQIIVKS